jgi:hypothetical protein
VSKSIDSRHEMAAAEAAQTAVSGALR